MYSTPELAPGADIGALCRFWDLHKRANRGSAPGISAIAHD
jgi:hypothetical protein